MSVGKEVKEVRTAQPNRWTFSSWLSRWWPYFLILGGLVLFPYIAGLVMGNASVVPEGAGFLEALGLRAESGYAKFWQGVIIQMLILGIFAMSYDILLGYTGLLSFGHAMFFGTGAYTVAILLGPKFQWGLGWALLAVFIIALIQGITFGLLSLRVKGVYLAMVTLALAEMFFILAEAGDFRQYTGADDGLHGFAVPAYLSPADHRTRFYFLTLIFFVAVFIVARRLVNSPTGRVMIAVRENENRTQMIGYNTIWYKLVAFVAAGMFAALAGALSALFHVSVTPGVLSSLTTINALAMTIIGGLGTLIGPILGAAIIQLLGYWLERWFGANWTLVYGLIFMIIVMFLPFGIIGTLQARAFRWRQGRARLLRLMNPDPK